MVEAQKSSSFKNQLNYTRDLISESFDRLLIEIENRRQHLLQKLNELEENYELVYGPARDNLYDLSKLKEQIDDSIKGNNMKDFKDQQLTDIDNKMEELMKKMSVEIKFSWKEYMFDSFTQILDQINIEVIVLERDSETESSIYFNSNCDAVTSPTLPLPSTLTQPKPYATACIRGNKAGELNSPRGVAVDESTHWIYIADHGNSRLQIFNYEGEYISQFSDTKADKPYGVALYETSLFVTMEGTNSVCKFSLDGKLLKKKGGKFCEKFKSPYGITVGANSTVYVCDYGNNRVQGLTTALKYSCTIGKGLLDGPMDVKTNGNEEILVLDSSKECLHVFTYEGELLRSMLTRGVANQLSNPWFFDVGCSGMIFMTDSSRSVINMFSSDGDILNTIGGSSGGAEFVFPTGIAVRSGNKPVCVFNKKSALLQIF